MAFEEEQLPPGVPETTEAVTEPRLRRPPFGLIALFLFITIGTWIPLAIFAKARVSRTTEPRVQIFQDMGTQPRYREQQSSDVFADGRADRPRVLGTVARGAAQNDDHYYRGFSRTQLADGKFEVKFFGDYPQQVKVTEEFIRRGQQRYNIACAHCHGLDGYAAGMVAVRSSELGTPLNPASLHSDLVRSRPEGHLYNTINVGIRTMGPHGHIVPDINDRWAIVAYVRALQASQMTPAAQVPKERLDGLR